MRAVSTVLDASLCLLLVTASALTLVGTPLDSESNSGANLRPEPNPDTADETAEVLTTTTARVTYAVGDRNRTAHDTLAGLLAAAALADAGEATASFERAVTAKVNNTFQRPDVGVQVVTDPIPDRNSPLGGRVVAGDTPPPNADVHAAVVEVRRVRLTVRTWS